MWKMGEELEGMYSIGIDQNQPLKGPLNLLGLLDRESRYPIYKSFYSQLPLNDALVLTRTCKKIRRDYLEKRWDIDRRLTRFVKHPLRFRSELGKHNSLISGSFALQFFAQTLWPEADLDVFVEDGAALASFDAYIQDEEKYELHTTNNCRGYAMNSLVEVRTYHRPLSMDPLKAKVQLVVTEEMPILDILQGFYTTAVINVISWNKAYAIFARSTFLDFKTYSLKPLDPFFIESLRKYHRRGWQWEETLRRQDYSSTSSLQPLRRIGDKHTWIIHLPTQGVKKAYQPDLVLEHSHFGIVCRRSSTGPSGPMAHHLISAANFGHISLEHRFVTNGRGDFSSFLAPRLDSPARMGILQAEPEERPDWAQNITEMINDIHLYTSRGVKAFVPPKHWRTFDNEIPRWYKQWYRPASLEDVDNLFS